MSKSSKVAPDVKLKLIQGIVEREKQKFLKEKGNEIIPEQLEEKGSEIILKQMARQVKHLPRIFKKTIGELPENPNIYALGIGTGLELLPLKDLYPDANITAIDLPYKTPDDFDVHDFLQRVPNIHIDDIKSKLEQGDMIRRNILTRYLALQYSEARFIPGNLIKFDFSQLEKSPANLVLFRQPYVFDHMDLKYLSMLPIINIWLKVLPVNGKMLITVFHDMEKKEIINQLQINKSQQISVNKNTYTKTRQTAKSEIQKRQEFNYLFPGHPYSESYPDQFSILITQN